MIKYALKCAQAHEFESWFQSAKAFETLVAARRLACPHCADQNIEKILMAPLVNKGKARGAAPSELKKLRAKIEAESEYVGTRFADEARKIHAGDAKSRSIYGEAQLHEAQKLIDEGVGVLPLPFIPRKKLQ